MVAHHSVLIFDVLGVSHGRSDSPIPPVGAGDHKVLRELAEILEDVSQKNVQESYHDLLQLKEEAGTLFSLGYLDLKARARVEQLSRACFDKIRRVALAVTVSRNGVSHSLRGKVFIRSTMTGGA